jgi:hypothetical protein
MNKQANQEDLEERAQRNYPDSPSLQEAWKKAVQYLRTCDSSASKWVLDRVVETQRKVRN